MGLRCLLGHDFGEPETEREREERGDEVVITVRQVETCDRCGERRIVSENKEVTALEQLLEAADPEGVDAARAASASVAADGTRAPEATGSEPSVDGAPDAAGDADGRDGAAFAADGFEPPRSAAEDDGVILDDGNEEPSAEREPGAWPDADGRDGADEESVAPESGTASTAGRANDADVDGNDGWPSADGEDEGFSAGTGETEPPGGVSFGAGLTPDRDARADGADALDSDPTPDEDAELLDAGAADGGDALGHESGIVDRGGDSVASGDDDGSDGFTRVDGASASEATTPVERTAYYCPECGLERAAGGSSLRAGDICPDCHSGYISERER